MVDVDDTPAPAPTELEFVENGEQCGGSIWQGPTECVAGHACVVISDMESLCRCVAPHPTHIHLCLVIPSSQPRVILAPAFLGSDGMSVACRPEVFDASAPAPTETLAATPAATASAPAPAATVSHEFEQCGGRDWEGPTVCAEGLGCVYDNEYYSQCRCAPSPLPPAC